MSIDDLIADLAARAKQLERGDPEPTLSAEALDAASALWEEAWSTPDSNRYLVAIVVAWLHWYRFLANPANQDDLAIAVGLFSVLSEVSPESSPSVFRNAEVTSLDPLTLAESEVPVPVRQSFITTKDPSVFARAIDIADVQAAAMADDDVRLGPILECQIAMRLARYRTAATVDDLSMTVAALRRLSDVAWENVSPTFVAQLSIIAIDFLRDRYEHTADEPDLHEACDLSRRAVHWLPPDHPLRPAMGSQLSYLMQLEYSRTGALADLDEAITVGRRAIDACGAGSAWLAGAVGHLCLALRERFLATGNVGDLDQAIEVGRAAAASVPPSDTARAVILSNLGLALRVRYNHIGATTDLDESIRLGRQAVDATDENDPNLGGYLSNLGLALFVRFRRFGEVSDIDDSIAVGRRAVGILPVHHPNASRARNNLSLAYRQRFGASGSVLDLDESIALAREAIGVLRDGDPLRSGYLNNLGVKLSTRFRHAGVPSDLDEAIAAVVESIETARSGNPEVANAQANLASFRFARFESSGNPTDAQAALDDWDAVANATLASARLRMSAARDGAQATARMLGVAAAVARYRVAAQLVPLLAWRGLDRTDRQRHLVSEVAILEAAASACAAGVPETACEMLEQGRAVMWSQMLETRAELDLLRQVRPELADALARCRAAIEPDPGGTSFDGVLAESGQLGAQQPVALLDRAQVVDGHGGRAAVSR